MSKVLKQIAKENKDNKIRAKELPSVDSIIELTRQDMSNRASRRLAETIRFKVVQKLEKNKMFLMVNTETGVRETFLHHDLLHDRYIHWEAVC